MSLAHLFLLMSTLVHSPSPGASTVGTDSLISLRVRADYTHRMVTVYRGGAVVSVYRLVRDERPEIGARLHDLLPLMRPSDAAALLRMVPASLPVHEGAPLRPEDPDGDGIVESSG